MCASCADASGTEIPGANRTEIVSIDSSMSGKNVLGRRDAAHPLTPTSAITAAITSRRIGNTRRSAEA
jgi:hypothetical protein